MPKFYADVDIKAPNLTITSSDSNKPLLTLEGSVDTQSDQPEIVFMKNSAAEDAEDLGIIRFKGLNDAGSPETIEYAYILGETIDVTDGSESGKITLGVDTTRLTGDLDVASKAVIPSRVYSQPGSATDGAHSAGDVWYFGNTGTTKGKIYYLNASATWTIANADAEVDATGMLAVALGDNSTDDGMLLRGMVTLYEINGTEDHGKKLFLHTADGEVSVTAPSTSGHFVRIIGYSLGNTTTNSDEVYFNPDNTFVELD